MIKTFIGKLDTYDIIDQQVNEFMGKKGKDLPARTQVDGNDYVVTVFYNGIYSNDNPIPEESAEEYMDKRKKFEKQEDPDDNKMGALWIQKDTSISGYLNEKRYTLTIQELTKNFEKGFTSSGLDMYEGVESGVKIRIVKTKKTKDMNPKYPDYIIFKV